MTDATSEHEQRPADPGGPAQPPGGHLTDKADLEVRSDGANAPIQGDDPQLRPGEVGDEDDAPDVVGGKPDDDRARDQRQALIDEVREDHAGD